MSEKFEWWSIICKLEDVATECNKLEAAGWEIFQINPVYNFHTILVIARRRMRS